MEAKRIKYPIGIQTFRNIVEGGYLYIDKTGFVHDLAENYMCSWAGRGGSGSRCCPPRSIVTSRGKRSCSRGWRPGNWRKSGRGIRCSILICQRLSIWTRMRSDRSTRKDIWFRTGLRGRIAKRTLRQVQRPAGYSSRSEWTSQPRHGRSSLGRSPLNHNYDWSIPHCLCSCHDVFWLWLEHF